MEQAKQVKLVILDIDEKSLNFIRACESTKRIDVRLIRKYQFRIGIRWLNRGAIQLDIRA